ncbi:MAG: AMP-binding protein [Gemmatimonadota bacterium]|nr:AMP-binding protein [Gemmatimonadota bacterium]
MTDPGADQNHIDWQLARFAEGAGQPAVIWRDREYSFSDLAAGYHEWLARLTAAGIGPGASVAVIGDFSPASVSALMALVRLDCILVPLARESRDQHAQFLEIAEVDATITLDDADHGVIATHPLRRNHPLLTTLRERGEPGLVLFSSGSTGKPKAILHALPQLLEKFRKPRHCYRTVTFLLFDHIGGFNTLFYTLANLGCVVVPEERSVRMVCRGIERHGAELLPTSPSFLNLLLLGDSYRDFDLSSLKLVTYGTEVMPERTLEQLSEALPHVRLQQTYGLSELGILRSKSASNRSLLVQVGGEDYETKVVDGTLRIRAKCSMLGYLNAPSPFDADGWFDTGDSVIQDGEYYRILGRVTEIINVGGQKVYPAEVEKVIAEIPGFDDVAVAGEAHLLLGNIVVATVQMREPLPAAEVKRRIHEHCRGRLQPYMLPAKVKVVTESLVNSRFKKVRRAT